MGDAMQVYDTLETLCKCMTRCNTCICACTCCALFCLLQEKQQKSTCQGIIVSQRRGRRRREVY